jgi:nitroimidazol reductase NimA-like FMN-containing flavoprotein (pyridoxamine 5'-phosphate oxidase superfamily)
MNADSQPPIDGLKTERVTLSRRPLRGSYDFGSVAAILDATFMCHVGFTIDGQPYVIPTCFGRSGERLYVHGSAASRMLGHLGKSAPVCVTVTLLDGIVLARSAFHHSINYRSVVILGRAAPVEGEEKLRALEIITEHIIAGRWADVRGPDDGELRATTVLAIDIGEASAKVRNGPPADSDDDLGRTCWAGVLPLVMTPQAPVASPDLAAGVEVPGYVKSARLGR